MLALNSCDSTFSATVFPTVVPTGTATTSSISMSTTTPANTQVPTIISSATLQGSVLVPFQLVFKSMYADYGRLGPYADHKDPDLFVIGSREQLERVYNTALLTTATLSNFGRIPVQHPFSRVNFNEYLVLGVFIGPRPNSGFDVDIKEITKTDLEVTITIVTSEGPGYLPTVTSPNIFVQVPKQDLSYWNTMTYIVKHPYNHIYIRKTL